MKFSNSRSDLERFSFGDFTLQARKMSFWDMQKSFLGLENTFLRVKNISPQKIIKNHFTLKKNETNTEYC
jgi:hypothetical protein